MGYYNIAGRSFTPGQASSTHYIHEGIIVAGKYFGFIYEWYNRVEKMFYLGSHFGSERDRYSGSGSAFKKAYKAHPEDFKRPPAVFFVSTDGINVSNIMNQYLISMNIKTQFRVHARASLVFDDSNGQLTIPNNISNVSLGLGWQDTGPLTLFKSGYKVESKSQGSRSHGRTLTIEFSEGNLTSTGVIKSQSDQHADSMTFQDAASKFAPPGYTVDVRGVLAGISRDYWSVNNQNFPSWINKMATETGGNVIANSDSFVVIPVGSDQGLPVIECDVTEGGNVIEWSIVPDSVLLQYQNYQALQYDNAAAVLMNDMGSILSGETTATNKSKAPTANQAEVLADANKRFGTSETKRGSIVINGEPSAAVGGWINVRGARAGVDGYYSIEEATHDYNRSSGFVTTLQLKNIVSATPPS
jgi:uncharacterized protein